MNASYQLRQPLNSEVFFFFKLVKAPTILIYFQEIKPPLSALQYKFSQILDISHIKLYKLENTHTCDTECNFHIWKGRVGLDQGLLISTSTLPFQIILLLYEGSLGGMMDRRKRSGLVTVSSLVKTKSMW